jgi:hypothetical protein
MPLRYEFAVLGFSLAALASPALSGCGDEVEADVISYHASIDPLMLQNTELGQRFIGLALEVSKNPNEIAKTAQFMQDTTLPELQALRSAAAAVQPKTLELQTIHSGLVTAWTAQSEGYTTLLDAFVAGDAPAFDQALKRVTDGKVALDAYIRQINTFIAPYDLRLDEYPS